MERLTDFVNDGDLDSEVIHTESEFASMSACLGASQTGVRTFTASASQGIALMHEVLHVVSGMRLPVVMAVANRALSAPINIWNDHQDTISERDSGWLQLFCESSQEALDTVIMAFKIAEDKNVLLPVMVCIDGFTLSHVWEPVDIPTQVQVREFLPKFKANYPTLDPRHPKTFGSVAFPNTYMEFKKQEHDAMVNALPIITKVNADFYKKFRRKYGDGLVEGYKLEGAKTALLCMGTMCGTTRVVVDELRKEGKKVGMIKLKSYRPFPAAELAGLTKGLESLIVVDRNISTGYEGAVLADVRAALMHQRIKINGFIAGLGGRDIKKENIHYMFSSAGKTEKTEWIL